MSPERERFAPLTPEQRAKEIEQGPESSLRNEGFIRGSHKITPRATEIEKSDLSARFDKLLRGRVKDVPFRAKFLSKLEGVDFITLIKPQVEDPKTLSVIVFFEEAGKKKHMTFSLLSDGTLSGALPWAFKGRIRREDILREVLDAVEDFEPDFWVTINKPILPPGEWPGQEPMEKKGPEKKKEYEPTIDLERLKFLRSQMGALFGFTNEQEGGFKKYHGIVFPNFVVLEHAETGNAAYFLDGIPRIEKTRLTRAEKEQVLQQEWTEWLAMTKAEHIAKGTTRVVHQGENWEKVMETEIRRRIAS